MKKLVLISTLGLSGCSLTGLDLAGAQGYNENNNHKISTNTRCMDLAYRSRQSTINTFLQSGQLVDWGLVNRQFKAQVKRCKRYDN